MGMPAAKLGDKVEGMDVHIVVTPAGDTPESLPFNGIIEGGLSTNVFIMNRPAATVGSTATNVPQHIPVGGSFQVQPTNQGTIIKGSATVFINKKPAARAGDTVLNCNDPVPAPTGTVVAVGTVLIGG
jgi:uncharacterized Zn-binding protein involved in type VI secretion